MLRNILSAFLVLLTSLPLVAQTVTVAAAANLSALEAPLQEAFSTEFPGKSVKFTFGSSGTLVTQILNGAPFQVFLSADKGFAQKLVDAGTAPGPVRTYAVGRLIFLSTKPLPSGAGLKILESSQVVQFATCNPETAPYGRATVEALSRSGLYEGVKSKEVRGQTVTQAVQFTLTSTGYGFVNQSALFAPELKPYREEGKFWFAVDPLLYAPLEQGFVVLKSDAAREEVQAFVRFLTGPAARKVFLDFGYDQP